MTSTVSYLAAFGGGVASFVSPCVLPIVPGYLSLVTGLDLTDAVQGSRHHLLRIARDTALFVLGFTVVFVLLGVTATTIGSAVFRDKELLLRISGALVVAMALFLAGSLVLKRPSWYREVRFHPSTRALRAVRGAGCRRSVRLRLATLPRADPRLGQRSRSELGLCRPRSGVTGRLLAGFGDTVSCRRLGTRPVVGHDLVGAPVFPAHHDRVSCGDGRVRHPSVHGQVDLCDERAGDAHARHRSRPADNRRLRYRVRPSRASSRQREGCLRATGMRPRPACRRAAPP